MFKWLTTIDRFRKYAIVMVVLTTIYLVWLVWAPKGILGAAFTILEFFMHAMVFMFVITNWTRRYAVTGGGYSMRTIVDVFISTINEPIEVIERTVKSATKINHPNTRVYILDDGCRDEVKELCDKYRVNYLSRGEDNIKDKPYKAANMNYAFERTYGQYILALDADQKVSPSIFDDVLGHFKDRHAGYVTTRQRFEVDKNDFNHDYLFYEYMQAGKASSFSPVSTGSGVVYRRSALDDIGGFQEWNIVEDLYTSVVLNEYGYKGIYVAQAYTIGLAPKRLKNIYKQRGIWAQDSLRLLFFKNPLFNTKLSVLQKITYFEVGYIYLVCGIFIPGIFILDIYSLLWNEPILKVGLSYLLFKLPSFFFILYVYNLMSRGSASTSMWTALFPVYSRATLRAMFYKKPKYKPTPKKESKRKIKDIPYVVPHLVLIGLSIFALAYNFLTYDINMLLLVKLTWIILLFII
ncbi:glycosyltransferase, partial [Patescibacteria group bacterium]|nr:glycosyltransferase [Patescibacteria group bacterium]